MGLFVAVFVHVILLNFDYVRFGVGLLHRLRLDVYICFNNCHGLFGVLDFIGLCLFDLLITLVVGFV